MQSQSGTGRAQTLICNDVFLFQDFWHCTSSSDYYQQKNVLGPTQSLQRLSKWSSLFQRNVCSEMSSGHTVPLLISLAGSIQRAKNNEKLQGRHVAWQENLFVTWHVDVHSSCIISLTVARALREIKYYQSSYAAEMLMIPQKRFQLSCHEITQDPVVHRRAGAPGSFKGDYRWEKDALIALQLMTEHILIMFFEMTYLPCSQS